MRCMKISTALLAVPLCLGALACENPTDTEQPEALTNPPAPSFAHLSEVTLANGCEASPGVTLRRGGKEVVGTELADWINCHDYDGPGSKGVTIRAGDGNDLVVGSQRDDKLFGGKGCDRVEGNDGDDLVDGGPGDDSPDAQGGCNDIPDYAAIGGAAIHIDGGLVGQDGDDEMKGGMGIDFMDGGAGTNTCEGGKGDDSGGFVNCDVCGDPDGDCP